MRAHLECRPARPVRSGRPASGRIRPLPPRAKARPGGVCACGGGCPGCRAAASEDERFRLERADQGAQPSAGPAAPAPAAPGAPASRPAGVDVWGLRVTSAMCGCRDRIRHDIAWATEAARTYASCNNAANATGDDVEACFHKAHPEATVVASTDSSGRMNLPPPSADPCQQVSDKATFVHETMHARHADAMARAQGGAFFQAWQALAGTPDRLEQLRARFPAQVAAFEAQWNNGADWASDEVNSYTWERRFLESALQALGQIC
jgi:hypothetical protein